LGLLLTKSTKYDLLGTGGTNSRLFDKIKIKGQKLDSAPVQCTSVLQKSKKRTTP
jgi:hypothetical protein